MSEIFTPAELRARFAQLPYITPYARIVALVDSEERLVELHEFHARGRCTGGAAWEVYHYARTSPLVLDARREGARNIFTCAEGRRELTLVPGIAAAGLEEVRIEGDEVALTYAGLAGGGVAAAICRGMAGNVISAEVHQEGGGASLGRATLRVPRWTKLVIGVDDTDDDKQGATWSTVNEIAFQIEGDGLADYLLHTIVQLFPDNPYRTTNCCATAIVMGLEATGPGQAVERVRELLSQRTFSDQCGMAWTTRVLPPEAAIDFAKRARGGMVTIQEARQAATATELVAVTGERGCIGALAATAAHLDPDAAVRLDGPEARG
ncbi:MAG TPA: methanogenesis marker protein 11 [Candidatus Anoxymicrobiaceae bacterium]|jgi:methanogenesis imperfect marker protein 11